MSPLASVCRVYQGCCCSGAPKLRYMYVVSQLSSAMILLGHVIKHTDNVIKHLLLLCFATKLFDYFAFKNIVLWAKAICQILCSFLARCSWPSRESCLHRLWLHVIHQKNLWLNYGIMFCLTFPTIAMDCMTFKFGCIKMCYAYIDYADRMQDYLSCQDPIHTFARLFT